MITAKSGRRVMEYESTITEMVRNADVALMGVVKSTAWMLFFIISTPTYIRADAAAAEGIAAKSGVANIAAKKRVAVLSAVRPVLPPAETPEPDSTKVVTVDVPIIAPAQVAMESASMILL